MTDTGGFKVPTTSDGKVHIKKFARQVLRVKHPFLYKLAVLSDWTIKIGYLWLLLGYFAGGVEGVVGVCVLGLFLAAFIYISFSIK